MISIPLISLDAEVTDQQFWHSISLYHNRPHLVNRRLVGVAQALFLRVNSIKPLIELFTRSAILYEVRKLKVLSKEYITVDFVKNILEPYDKNVILEEATLEDLLIFDESVFVSVRILLPRQDMESCLEIVILDPKNKTCTFYGVSEFDKKALVPLFPYNISLTSKHFTIELQTFEDAETASAEWLSDRLFPKLVNWMNNYQSNVIAQPSMSLVCLEHYTDLYQRLKKQYGKKIVEAWTEKTDPLKFVYEDIAIASYLISLWKIRHPNNKPTFVDLGCGNGLLVYILNQEGFLGEGIDVRKRKIWEWYSNTSLRVETIKPSVEYQFPDIDWIIGNHSDELTLWIPIIASQSSYKCNFFLLPCCAYEFNGEKYKRRNTSVSVYSDHLNYVRDVCAKCGIMIANDKLRIPSTKRNCIVSQKRTYNEEEYGAFKKKVLNYMNTQLNDQDVSVRQSTEKIRNCTRLNQDFLINIIKQICSILLNSKDVISKESGGTWNKGGLFALPKLAVILEKCVLRCLKNECGGLQTLLKNYRYIFEVNQGTVKLRLPATAEKTESRYKSKLCWFHLNHPDGCLHNETTCAYQH
ncbi:hypothetical protein FQA39_LY08594 [Lamprigera yunnana]|nr:hypothetical protein FQA39_LY08594 [Lamprigera yunnana]